MSRRKREAANGSLARRFASDFGRDRHGHLVLSGETRADQVAKFGNEDLLDLALIELSETDCCGPGMETTERRAGDIIRSLTRIWHRVIVDEPRWVLKLLQMRGAPLYELTPAFRPWPYWLQHLRALGKHAQAHRAEHKGQLIVPSYWPWVTGPTVTATDDNKQGEA